MPKVQPVVGWAGGKRRVADLIIAKIPASTKCYAEVFCGGAAVLAARPPSGIEVINDKNGELINLYRILKFHPDELAAEIRFHLNSREEFDDFRHQPGLTDIQRAARWLTRRKNCFGGDPEYFGRSKTSGGASAGSRSGLIERAMRFSDRLDRVIIENLDWRDFFKLYDGPGTFFFCDPPYVLAKANSYDAFSDADVAELAETLKGAQGKWLVTLDDTKQNRKAFTGCTITTFQLTKGCRRSSTGKVGKRTELLITPKK